MIRRLIIMLAAAYLVLMSAGITPGMSKEMIIGVYGDIVEFLGGIRLTDDIFLSGERSSSRDGYSGEYVTNVKNKTGTETVFGGTSLYEKDLEVIAKIDGSGGAYIKLTAGWEETVLEPDEDGKIEYNFDCESGGNYIEVVYEDFTGEVRVRVEDRGQRSEDRFE